MKGCMEKKCLVVPVIGEPMKATEYLHHYAIVEEGNSWLYTYQCSYQY